MSRRPRAGLGFDLDTAADHLQGYGHGETRPAADDPVYTRALPRILDSLEKHDVRATFFVIARDAAAQADRLREIVRRGHEVASHSFAHRQPFSRRPAELIFDELKRSKESLEEASASEVVGFRAPGWDLGPRVLEVARQVGFEYDASIFPGPFLPLLRLVTWWLGDRRREIFQMATWRWVFARRGFHRRSTGDGREIVELPLTLAPILGIPLYRTMAAYVGERRLARLVRWSRRWGRDLSFAAHGVDFLDVEDDRLDPRLRAHPGLESPLPERAVAWDRWLAEIRGLYRFAPFREHAAELRRGGGAATDLAPGRGEDSTRTTEPRRVS